jgi:Ser/Thr protein kinase RdoA (MazF antagonist)
VRAWPEKGLSWDRLRGLHRLLEHVHRHGITQVAVPVATREGRTLVACENRYWQLEPWMPGAADFSRHPTDARLSAALRCLAGWHQAAATFVPRAAEQRWFFSAAAASSSGIAERIEQIDSWTPARCERLRTELARAEWAEFCKIGQRVWQLFLHSAPAIRAELQAARDRRLRVQPCLRDVWHDHLLFTADEVTGLIDPGSCRTENVAADLARLLGSLLGDDRQRRAFAIDVYRQCHPLTFDELALIELFDRSQVLLGGMTWLDWQLLQGRHFSNRPAVIARLEQIRERLERLAR